MPELVTHSALGWLLGQGVARARPGAADPLLVAIGACLPDWISHGYIVHPEAFRYIGLLHEPVPIVLIAALVGSFFPRGQRTVASLSLVLGGLSHYLLDLLQHHAYPVNYPLFPFSMLRIGFRLYSIESSVVLLPLVALFLVLWGVGRIWRRTRNGDAR